MYNNKKNKYGKRRKSKGNSSEVLRILRRLKTKRKRIWDIHYKLWVSVTTEDM